MKQSKQNKTIHYRFKTIFGKRHSQKKALILFHSIPVGSDKNAWMKDGAKFKFQIENETNIQQQQNNINKRPNKQQRQVKGA